MSEMEKKAKVKVKGEGQGEHVSMKRVTLCRNCQCSAHGREVSCVKKGTYKVGQHVMLGITGDRCYGRNVYSEFEVISVEPTDAFGGRDKVTFLRVQKRPAKCY